MNDKIEKRKRSWRVVSVGLGLLFLVPVLLCIGVATWFVARQAKAAAKVDARIEQLLEVGDPIDDDTMQTWYQMNTDSTRTGAWVELGKRLETETYRKLASKLPFLGFEQTDQPLIVPPPGQDWPDRKRTDEFFQIYKEDVALLLKLGIEESKSTGKPLRRPVVFDSYSTLLPDIQRLTPMANLLQLRHAVAVRDKDRDLSLKCIVACRGLEQSTYAEPFMVSHLVGRSVSKICNGMIQRSLQYDQLTDDQIDQLIDGFPDFQKLHAMYVVSLKGERAMQLSVLMNPEVAKEAAAQNAQFGQKTPLLLPGARGIDTLFALETMDSFINVPNSDPQSFITAVEKAGVAIQKNVSDQSLLTRMDHAVSHMLLPAVDSYAKAIVTSENKNRLAKLAMSVRKYQHLKDRFPKSLDELYDWDASLKSLTAADGTALGFQITAQGDAVLWGGDEAPFGDEPPELDSQDNGGLPWIWRLESR